MPPFYRPVSIASRTRAPESAARPAANSVATGDTITVLVGRKEIKVCLAKIDAPEKRQRAKQAMSELVFGKTVGLFPLTAIGMEERLVRYLPRLKISTRK